MAESTVMSQWYAVTEMGDDIGKSRLTEIVCGDVQTGTKRTVGGFK